MRFLTYERDEDGEGRPEGGLNLQSRLQIYEAVCEESTGSSHISPNTTVSGCNVVITDQLC